MNNTERLMQSKLANSIFFIKFCQCSLHLFWRIIFFKFKRQFTNTCTDSGIIYLAFLRAGHIICNQRIFCDTKILNHRFKIIIIKFLDNYYIMKSCLINTSFYLSSDFTTLAISILIIH